MTNYDANEKHNDVLSVFFQILAWIQNKFNFDILNSICLNNAFVCCLQFSYTNTFMVDDEEIICLHHCHLHYRSNQLYASLFSLYNQGRYSEKQCNLS